MDKLEGFFRRSDKVVKRQIAGETLLIPINQTGADLQKVYVLNETGAALWDKLEEASSLKDLTGALLAEYDATEDTIRSELTPLMGEFVARGFIFPVESDC